MVRLRDLEEKIAKGKKAILGENFKQGLSQPQGLAKTR